MFFTYLNQVLSPGVDLHLTVSKTSAGMVVALLPKINGLKDPAQNRIVPLRMTGTPQDLDAQFFPTVTAPVQKTGGLLINMKQFEEQADQAAKSSKAVKTAKETGNREAKEKKEKYDSFIRKAEEQEAAGNLEGAITNLQQARLHATEKQVKTVDEKIAALRSRISQQSLFGEEPAGQQPAPQAAQQPQPQQQAAPPVQAPVQQPPVQQTEQPGAPMAHPQQTAQQMMPPAQQPVQQQMAPPAQAQQPPVPQTAPPLQPQQAQPQAAGMQPNVQGFGIFGQPAMPQEKPGTAFMPEGPLHNPKDYEDIPDVHLTHVGEILNNQAQI